jgi:putative ATP-binding cassette transporter
MQKGSDQKLDLTTWRNFIKLAKPFFFSEKKFHALALIALLIGLSISVTRLSVWMGDITGNYMNALTDKNSAEFYHYILLFALAVACTAPVAVFYRYTEEKFSLLWRRWLTQHFLERYFSHRSYYRINIEKTLDNPDQRIVDEIRGFTGTSISFLLIVFNSSINLFAWTSVLWGVSSKLTYTSFGYSFFGSLMTMLIGRRLVALNFAQVKKEADFRYGLVQIRDNSEPIALYRGEEKESLLVTQRLKDALKNLNILIGWNRNLGFFIRSYDYFKSVLPVLIVAPLYFQGGVKFGTIALATIAFTWVLDALSLIVSQFERLSSFAATISRLSTLSEELDQGDRYCVWPREDPTWITIGTDTKLVLQKLCVMTPNRQRTLIKDLTFELPEGKYLLISGASGVGKTSLFRAIAGLWTDGQGTIMRPELSDIVFLPQTPYMVQGNFRQQLRSSIKDENVSDEELKEVLHKVKLSQLLARLGGFDVEFDWGHILSLGEQQRIAFARLFLAKPKISFLDEATTALGLDNERDLYDQLRNYGKSYISIGHRPSLLEYHHYHLELLGEGNWKVSQLR